LCALFDDTLFATIVCGDSGGTERPLLSEATVSRRWDAAAIIDAVPEVTCCPVSGDRTAESALCNEKWFMEPEKKLVDACVQLVNKRSD